MREDGYSILLIEDDEQYAQLVARMLENQHSVTVVHNCMDARHQVIDRRFDCALVDFELPDGGGTAFIRELVVRELPVIVLTGHDEEELGINTVQLGAQDYLTKSDLTPKLLRRSLRYAVEREQSRLRMLEAEHERKALEKQFHQAQKMEAIGRLAGGVAHDFNNLLTAIIGFSRFVLDELAPGDHRREDLIHVLKAADRAETLTRQLLAFSRKQTIEPRVLDLNELISNIEKLVRRTIGEHIDIRLSMEDDLWPVKVDAAQFEQVLMNMAVNARDAMQDGGKLRITTKNDPSGRVLVFIEDNGMGMPAEVQSQIFEPFFTTKDRNSGTGLGLATCYGIIKQSGGEITVESTLGKGTRFCIELPRDRGAAQPLTELRPDHQEQGLAGDARILVIEDDERVRALTVRMLRKHGYSTIEASTTREGRDVFDIEDGKIDLIVSDIVMPDGRGPDLAVQICQRDPNMRFLLMTGYDDDSLDQKTLSKIPTYEVLRKPFVESALLRSVRDLLGRPRVAPVEAEATVARDEGGKPRVLLVDDDAGTRRTYQRLFGDDFDLQVLDDSLDDVLDALKKENFDIIFFDVMMPRVSGFDLAERARTVSPDNADRIIHLTGMQDDALVNAYAKQTKQHIVSKPLTMEKLKQLLDPDHSIASA